MHQCAKDIGYTADAILNSSNSRYDNKFFYEPLLHTNLDQASDLKKELIKLFDNSTHEGFKAMIEGLKIFPKAETIDSVDVDS